MYLIVVREDKAFCKITRKNQKEPEEKEAASRRANRDRKEVKVGEGKNLKEVKDLLETVTLGEDKGIETSEGGEKLKLKVKLEGLILTVTRVEK